MKKFSRVMNEDSRTDNVGGPEVVKKLKEVYDLRGECLAKIRDTQQSLTEAIQALSDSCKKESLATGESHTALIKKYGLDRLYLEDSHFSNWVAFFRKATK